MGMNNSSSIKERLDKLILEKGILDTRERAKAYIIGGNISVNGETVRKPGRLVIKDAKLELKLPNNGWVSRGGLKLEGAIKDFNIDVKDKYCIDIGSSTGGFTHCLLKNGAKLVTAVDVGKNQIAYKLRKDPRVEVVERFNARYIDRLKIFELPDIVTIDVSFISLRLILNPLRSMLKDSTDIIALIKPQFELEKRYKGFKGVVKNKSIHREILYNLNSYFLDNEYGVKRYGFSKLKGPKGNIEYFANLGMRAKENINKIECEMIIDRLVQESHNYFSKNTEEKND